MKMPEKNTAPLATWYLCRGDNEIVTGAVWFFVGIAFPPLWLVAFYCWISAWRNLRIGKTMNRLAGRPNIKAPLTNLELGPRSRWEGEEFPVVQLQRNPTEVGGNNQFWRVEDYYSSPGIIP